MPSIQVGFFSGGQVLISGNPWSGTSSPSAYVLLRWDRHAAGDVYISLSGGMHIMSGGSSSSGGTAYSGLLDGMQLGPGDTYQVPKPFTGNSGSFNIFAMSDVAASGTHLMYEVF